MFNNVHHCFRLPLRPEAFQLKSAWLLADLHFSPSAFNQTSGRPHGKTAIEHQDRHHLLCAAAIVTDRFEFHDRTHHGETTMRHLEEKTMIQELRMGAVLCIFFLALGCGESKTSVDSRTYHGAFNNIVIETDTMQDDVNSDHYDGRLEPVPDQFGAAVHAFLRNEDVKGTPLEAEAQKLLDKEQEIMEIWRSPDGSLEKLRSAVKEVVDQVEHMKTLI